MLTRCTNVVSLRVNLNFLKFFSKLDVHYTSNTQQQFRYVHIAAFLKFLSSLNIWVCIFVLMIRCRRSRSSVLDVDVVTEFEVFAVTQKLQVFLV